MMRVEIQMSRSFRGLVDQYAQEKGKTMPEAYRDLLEIGLLVADVEIENFSPRIDIENDAVEIADREEEEYELVLKGEART